MKFLQEKMTNYSHNNILICILGTVEVNVQKQIPIRVFVIHFTKMLNIPEYLTHFNYFIYAYDTRRELLFRFKFNRIKRYTYIEY